MSGSCLPRKQAFGINNPRPSATSSPSNILRRNQSLCKTEITMPNHHQPPYMLRSPPIRIANVVLEEQREALWYQLMQTFAP